MENNITLLENAIQWALHAHKGQLDKNGVSYVFHPIRLMVMAQALGLDKETQAIAVLHDVVEDTDVTLSEIRTVFGERVALGVDALTRRNGKNAEVINGVPVDETYMNFVRRAALNADARKVKMLDNADNMRPERRIKGNDFKLPLRYKKASRFLTNANVIAGDMDFIIGFRRLHPWVRKYEVANVCDNTN
jgi:(p)ppGpp synthase/HD superfamily hydrolase